jgi:surface polysaccharide O-acyltransferase-like enzyme
VAYTLIGAQVEHGIAQGAREKGAMPEFPVNQTPGGRGIAKPRDLAVDVLKILAIFEVVAAHSCDQLLDVAGSDVHLWWVSNVFLSCGLYCVSLFVICSGAMILTSPKDEPPLTFYGKRLPKIVIPLASWSVVYYFYKIGNAPLTFADIPLFIKGLLSGTILPQLWFLYMLVGVYLSTPFLRMFMRQATRSQIWIFVFLCLVVVPPNPMLEQFLGVSVALNYQIFSTFIGLFVLGYLLQTAKKVTMRGSLGLFLMYLLLVLIAIMGNGLLRIPGAKPDLFFLKFDVITVSLTAAVVFVFVRSLPLGRLAPWSRVIILVSNASYGIYLVHILVRFLLKHGMLGFTIKPLMFDPVMGVIITAVSIFFISLAFVLLLKQIPYLRQTVGYGKPISLSLRR